MSTSTIKKQPIEVIHKGYFVGGTYTFTIPALRMAFITVKTSNGNDPTGVWVVSRYGNDVGVSKLCSAWDQLTVTADGTEISVYSRYGCTLTVTLI